MRTSYIRYKFNLRSLQISFLSLFLLCSLSAQSQHKNSKTNKTIEQSRLNLPEYDNRLFSYGFTIGLHLSALRPKFADVSSYLPAGSQAPFVQYDDGAGTPVYNIENTQSFGFSLGFLGNLRAAQYLDIRFMPRVGFYDFGITYLDGEGEQNRLDPPPDFTTLDLSLSAKFKSTRRGNYRMFLTAGATPMINVSSKKKLEEASKFLSVKGNNLTADVGFGVDIYFPLFKFSPEVRYSYGIPDLKASNEGQFDPNFSSLGSQVWALYLVFN